MHENPTPAENVLRFGCGAVGGVMLGVVVVLTMASDSRLLLLCIILLLAVVCGGLAMTYGDRFWHTLARWLP